MTLRHATIPPTRLVAALVGGALLLLAATGARAATVLTCTLDGATAGADSPASGFARLVLNDAETLVTYEITYEDLQGEEFAAHIHSGPEGNFGAIVHQLPLGTPKVGAWEPSPRRVAELLAGQASIMIHTDLHPEGEIGGWLAVDGTPAAPVDWSALKRLFR